MGFALSFLDATTSTLSKSEFYLNALAENCDLDDDIVDAIFVFTSHLKSFMCIIVVVDDDGDNDHDDIAAAIAVVRSLYL